MSSFLKHAPFVLFFDCFIVSSKMSIDDAYFIPNNKNLGDIYLAIRSTATVYHHVSKLQIVKYTLLSYSAIPWDEIVLRVECEDEDDREDFFIFLKQNFPTATVVNKRSATVKEYYEALLALQRHGNPWVFFCPNNDHPLVGAPSSFSPLLELAEEVEPLYPEHFVSIMYSHFTETQIGVNPDQYNWLYNRAITAEIGETSTAHIIQQDVFCCDSIQIYRLASLLSIFSQSTNQGRCIRLEDTGFLQSKKFRQIVINPKNEICRHFDSYVHVNLPVPPLFIPPGFFESNIKIRYGYNTRLDGYVNVNPYEQYSYLGGVADVKSLLSELPVFWKNRVTSIDVNPELNNLYNSQRDNSFQFIALKNPFSDISVLQNYMRSAWKACGLAVSHFNEALCTAEYLKILENKNMSVTNGADTTVVLFILSGMLSLGNKKYFKRDLLVLQGECNFLIEDFSENLSILKVVLQFGAAPGLKYISWQEINGTGSSIKCNTGLMN